MPEPFRVAVGASRVGGISVRAAGEVELPEALSAAEEPVVIYERLAARLPQAFTIDLRSALNALARVFEALGRNHEAAQVWNHIDRLG